MIGIWSKESGTGADGLIGATGRDQVTALIAHVRPAGRRCSSAWTTACTSSPTGAPRTGASSRTARSSRGSAARKQIKITATAIFSPANMRAGAEVAGYKKLMDYYMDNKYTLRYSGGLVPDVYQQFTKNMGIFTNPTSDKSPAKLRLAFEASPFGLLVEAAGGKTSDGVTGGSVLDVQINAVDQRDRARHRVQERGRPLQLHGARQVSATRDEASASRRIFFNTT